MLNHTFTWDGHCSDEFGIKIERFRALNRPSRKYDAASVPGRNGNIYKLQDAWSEQNLSYQIFAQGRPNLAQTMTDIMEWLHSADGYARLSDTYDPDHYREAVFVDSTDIENSWNTIGRAVVTFRCRPERFLNEYENVALDLTDTVQIGYVNSFSLNFREGPNINYDTIWVMPKGTQIRKIDQTLSGTVSSGHTINIRDGWGTTGTTVIDYLHDTDKFYFTEKQTVDGATWYHVKVERDNIDGYINGTYITEQTWYKVRIIDRTSSRYEFEGWCQSDYITLQNAIVYKNPTNHIARPFIKLTAASYSTLSLMVNTVNLNSSSTFYYELDIDCEHLNCEATDQYGSYYSYNSGVSVTDNAGDPSPDFIALYPGDNYFVVGGSISGVSMDARLWEV